MYASHPQGLHFKPVQLHMRLEHCCILWWLNEWKEWMLTPKHWTHALYWTCLWKGLYTVLVFNSVSMFMILKLLVWLIVILSSSCASWPEERTYSETYQVPEEEAQISSVCTVIESWKLYLRNMAWQPFGILFSRVFPFRIIPLPSIISVFEVIYPIIVVVFLLVWCNLKPEVVDHMHSAGTF